MTDFRYVGSGGEQKSPVLTGRVAITFGSQATNVGASASATIGGLTAGHDIFLTPVNSVAMGLAGMSCTTNTVTVTGVNMSAGTVNEGALNYQFFAWKR